MESTNGSSPQTFATATKAEADVEKIEKLKELNNDLVKETMETRKKIKLIQSQMMELCGDLDDSLVAGLDLSISLAYLKMSVDEKKAFEFKERDKLAKENQELRNKILVLQTNHYGMKNGELWEQINVMKKAVEAVKDEMDEMKYLEYKNKHGSKIFGLQEEIIRLSSRVTQMRRNGCSEDDLKKVSTTGRNISSDIKKKVKTMFTVYLHFVSMIRNTMIPKAIRICKEKMNEMDLGHPYIVALKMEALKKKKNKLYKAGEEKLMMMKNHVEFLLKMLGNGKHWGFMTSIVGFVTVVLIVVFARKP